MTIEEAEETFNGKRWDTWSENQIILFVKALTVAELGNPACLFWAVQYEQYITDEVRDHLLALLAKHPPKKKED